MNQSKWLQFLHSRTVGVLAFMFLTDALSLYSVHIPPSLLLLINLALTSLANYFHINPTTPGQYSPAGVPPPVTPVVVDTTTEEIVPDK
jgi:hypothetical protein